MPNNHLNMSDEDFLKQSPPETGEATSVTPPASQEPEAQEDDNKTPEADAKPDNNSAAEQQDEQNKTAEPKPNPDEGEQEKEPAPTGSSEAKASDDPNASEKPTEKQGEEKSEDKSVEAAPNYEDLYSKIMAPFMANGKKIELKDPAEAIQLMQMGANYTRKMQEMAPGRKILTMLQNNNLLDESKLSYLIDLDKHDPEAIKKLIKDSGTDPLDIDTNTEPAYREGNHRVSDQEVAFRTQLDDMTSTQEGKQTLTEIEQNWDQVSKDMLWDHPQVMAIIHSQRENGIYAKITEEMDRQKTMGKIPPEAPFLQVYKDIGDKLEAAGAFNNPGTKEKQDETPTPAVVTTTTPTVVTTRTATPKPEVDPGDKAGAASPSRSAPGKAKEAPNFLSMSDEDFLKSEHFRGRL